MATGESCTSTQCDDHQDHITSAWCEECDVLVCMRCITNDTSLKHSGHTFKSLDHIAKRNFATIELKKEEIRKLAEEYTSVLDEHEQREVKFDQQCSELDKQIDERRQDILDELDFWTHTTKVYVQDRVNNERKTLNSINQKMETGRAALLEAFKFCDTPDHIAALKRATSTLDSYRYLPHLYEPSDMCLKSGEETREWRGLFGRISIEDTYGSDEVVQSVEVDTHSDTSEENISIVVREEKMYDEVQLPNTIDLTGQIQIDLHCPENASITLAADDNYGVWIACVGGTTIRHIDKAGKTLKQLESGFRLYGIGINSQQEIYATMHKGGKVKRKSKVSWKTVVNAKPFNTYGICFGLEDELFVCLQFETEVKIGRYLSTGSPLQSISLQPFSTKLTTGPLQIRRHTNRKDIVVSDMENVIAITEAGHLRYARTATEYRDTAATEYDCFSVCMAVDKNGHCFVVDGVRKSVSVLDYDGTEICSMDFPQAEQACCAVFDKEDNLCIASRDGNMYKGTARLRFVHKLE